MYSRILFLSSCRAAVHLSISFLTYLSIYLSTKTNLSTNAIYTISFLLSTYLFSSSPASLFTYLFPLQSIYLSIYLPRLTYPLTQSILYPFPIQLSIILHSSSQPFLLSISFLTHLFNYLSYLVSCRNAVPLQTLATMDCHISIYISCHFQHLYNFTSISYCYYYYSIHILLSLSSSCSTTWDSFYLFNLGLLSFLFSYRVLQTIYLSIYLPGLTFPLIQSILYPFSSLHLSILLLSCKPFYLSISFLTYLFMYVSKYVPIFLSILSISH